MKVGEKESGQAFGSLATPSGVEGGPSSCQTRGFTDPMSDGNPMDQLTEPQVIFAAKKGGVEHLRAVATEQGFTLFAKLKGFKEEQPIYTTRKEPKQWASLDRLARHISANFGESPPSLIVEFRSKTHETDSSGTP